MTSRRQNRALTTTRRWTTGVLLATALVTGGLGAHLAETYAATPTTTVAASTTDSGTTSSGTTDSSTTSSGTTSSGTSGSSFGSTGSVGGSSGAASTTTRGS